MTEGFTNFVIDGNGNLVIPSEQSPNFVSGVSGWQIRADGSVEFNAGTFRGTITTDGDVLLYSPTPGAGNLVFSLSGTGNTDPYGNTYPAGIALAVIQSGAANPLNASPAAIRWGIAGDATQLPHIGTYLTAVFPFSTIMEIAGRNSVVPPADQRARIQLVNLGSGGSRLILASEDGDVQVTASTSILLQATTGISLQGAPINFGAGGSPFSLLIFDSAPFTVASGTNSVTITPSFVTPFTAAPKVIHSVRAGSNFKIVSALQAVGTANMQVFLYTPSGANVPSNESGNLDYIAIGS